MDTPFRDKRGGTPEAAPAMTAEHIADTIVFVVNQPAGVDINHITMRPARAARLTPGTHTSLRKGALDPGRAVARGTDRGRLRASAG
ncbi:hypothetical protein ACFVZL_05910 [Streptomyces sp. NPDC058320]|uniref:hypothetical protein n=1 Tax=unclassified Streptomyces TaxID=2593676 RepID=UPI003644E264